MAEVTTCSSVHNEEVARLKEVHTEEIAQIEQQLKHSENELSELSSGAGVVKKLHASESQISNLEEMCKISALRNEDLSSEFAQLKESSSNEIIKLQQEIVLGNKTHADLQQQNLADVTICSSAHEKEVARLKDVHAEEIGQIKQHLKHRENELSEVNNCVHASEFKISELEEMCKQSALRNEDFSSEFAQLNESSSIEISKLQQKLVLANNTLLISNRNK